MLNPTNNKESKYIMKKYKIVGIVFSIVAVVFSIVFILQLDFSIQLESYLKLRYYTQFTPVLISAILLYGGVLLIKRKSKTNFILAVFGHEVLEEILFNWIGLAKSNLPIYAVVVFFGIALVALWIAYFNVFSLKALTFKEIVYSFILGGIISLLPIFF